MFGLQHKDCKNKVSFIVENIKFVLPSNSQIRNGIIQNIIGDLIVVDNDGKEVIENGMLEITISFFCESCRRIIDNKELTFLCHKCGTSIEGNYFIYNNFILCEECGKDSKTEIKNISDIRMRKIKGELQ